MRYLHRHVGSSRLAEARRELERELTSWSAQWRADHASAPLTVDISETPPAADSRARDWHALRAVTGDVHLGATAAGWRHLVFGRADDLLPDDGVAGRLLAQARTDLLQRLATDGKAGETEAAIPDDGRSRIHARLRIAGEDTGIRLALDAARFNHALPPARPRNALAPRTGAAGTATLALQLRFPVATVSAEDIGQLAPGIVVRSSQRLDEPLSLGTADRPDILPVHLGRQGNRLAVRIAAPTRPGART